MTDEVIHLPVNCAPMPTCSYCMLLDLSTKFADLRGNKFLCLLNQGA